MKRTKNFWFDSYLGLCHIYLLKLKAANV